MDLPGYILLSRLTAQQRATDVLATNLANADTPGFRGSETIFTAELQKQGATGRDAAFTKDRATWRDFSPGAMQATGNPLDLAIGTDGFFAVDTERGERFTRAGRFTLSGDGRIVDTEGHPVLSDQGQPIAVPAGETRFEVMGDGTIRTAAAGVIGRLRVVRFADPQRLTAEGDRLFAAPDPAMAEPVARPGIVQGSLEGSNVKPVAELARLMAATRDFQFASQFAQSEGERLQTAIDRILRHN
ncbi:flagellar basal-body rod protein FlgF [Roseicella aquatilis]|uniref:Flagellar basal-body rod protein FlgF n=1 Tax=Roseicella aquatilis TaxID=2527868 RepID=A0A4R4D6I9_9PROT|nr:flagellar basal-body rod protein FlgF [Roseicella aquatilis]TCZ53666.1 flagellar basal-body rod protein FlgF [Roseicella aquatilis]